MGIVGLDPRRIQGVVPETVRVGVLAGIRDVDGPIKAHDAFMQGNSGGLLGWRGWDVEMFTFFEERSGGISQWLAEMDGSKMLIGPGHVFH